METNLWIARDINDELFIYTSEPKRQVDIFVSTNGSFSNLEMDMYPEVTWDNSPVKLITNFNK